MKILYKLIGILCVLNSYGYGQHSIVTGKIVDEKKQAISYATVAFKNKQDSSKVLGTLSNDQGQFSIKIPHGRYRLEVSAVGNKPYQKDLNILANLNLGTISIQTTVTLDQVVVVADNTQDIALDKKVYNISQELLAGGGSLIDVMQNIPSVQVEVDGRVSIRGSGNVQILIDGRNSGFTDANTFLRTIPAGSIERIEVITNPSSKYVAEGTGGIINVVLKKGRKKRLTSSFEVFFGNPLNAGANVNISKGGRKLSWYFNTGVGYSEPKKLNEIRLERLNNMVSDETQQFSEKVLKQQYLFSNLGGQLMLNKAHRLAVDVTYRQANLRNEDVIDYQDYNRELLVNQSQRLDTEIAQNNLIRLSTTYRWKTNDLGGNLGVKLFVQSSSEDGNSVITDQSLLPVASISSVDRSANFMTDFRYNLSADYVQPIDKNTQIELGGLYRTTQIQNDFEVERTLGGVSSKIPEFTDRTSYNEVVYAFYAQYKKTYHKLKYQLGLRSETTNILIATENKTKEQAIFYTNLFPSAFVHYDVNAQHKIRLSVSRRIRRPRLRAIIPFSSFSDSRNVLLGNPSVNPSYVIVSELGYQGELSKRVSITPTFFYNHTTQVMDYFIQKGVITINGLPEEPLVRTTVNIGNRHHLGLELGVSYRALSWLSLYSEVVVSGFKQTGSFQEVDYNSTGMISVGRVRFNFHLPKSFKLQLQHRFIGGNKRGQFIRRSVYRMDLGISKQLFHKKATLSFNLKDVFNTWWYRVYFEGDSFRQNIVAQVRTPQANISLIYLWNQKKYKGKKGKQYDKF